MEPYPVQVFPNEIIDLCIDNLGSTPEDLASRQALLSCSLVSHSFAYRSQKHLFAIIPLFSPDLTRITSKHLKCLQKLRRVLEDNTRLCSLVTTLDIYIDVDGEIQSSSNGLPAILDILNDHGVALHTLKITECSASSQWSWLGEAFRSSLIRLLSASHLSNQGVQGAIIRKLHLSYIDFPIDLLTLPSFLEELSLFYAETTMKGLISTVYPPSGMEMMNPPDPPCHWKILRMSSGCPISLLKHLSLLSKMDVISELRVLEVGFREAQSEELDAIWQLMLTNAKTLQSVTLQEEFNEYNLTLAFPEHVNFSLLPSLYTLRLKILEDDEQSHLPKLQPLFQLLDPPGNDAITIHNFELFIDIDIAKPEDTYTLHHNHHRWEHLDTFLTGPRFPNLRKARLKVRLNLWYHITAEHKSLTISTIENTLSDYFSSSLPLLSTSTKIKFEPSITVVHQCSYLFI